MLVMSGLLIFGNTPDLPPLKKLCCLNKLFLGDGNSVLREAREMSLEYVFPPANLYLAKEHELPSKKLQSRQEAEITLTCVYDNYQVNPALQTDWGFACVIQTSRGKLLFDTGGNSNILLSNMEKMGIRPGSITLVFISHVHGDHLGGLKGFLKKNNQVTVFISDTFPESVREMIKSRGAKYVEIANSKKIVDSIYSTGVLYGPPSEQSLIIETEKGLVIVTGCAHPGIGRIVKKAQQLLGRKVYLVVGGFHHPPREVVEEFRKLGVKKVAPSHCTGDEVREAFRREYGQDFIEFGVGRIIQIKNN
jgi:7,8-dihydropterin-6-yl-methyl-4-(beta-D-ribofuranosyl)aminobenzene 5'-phosphate synthase